MKVKTEMKTWIFKMKINLKLLELSIHYIDGFIRFLQIRGD